MSVYTTIRELSRDDAEQFVKDDKISRFGPVRCSRCNENAGFGRRVFEILGAKRGKELDDEFQNVTRFHFKQRYGIELVFFRTHRNRIFVDSAECQNCKSTAIIFDILDKQYFVRELCQVTGTSEEQVTSELEKVAAKLQTVKATKVGRNDPCPCGSGKKYKKCCGSG
ncbi:conserved hypothetical protein [Gammaproteobacteria bacterium]